MRHIYNSTLIYFLSLLKLCVNVLIVHLPGFGLHFGFVA